MCSLEFIITLISPTRGHVKSNEEIANKWFQRTFAHSIMAIINNRQNPIYGVIRRNSKMKSIMRVGDRSHLTERTFLENYYPSRQTSRRDGCPSPKLDKFSTKTRDPLLVRMVSTRQINSGLSLRMRSLMRLMILGFDLWFQQNILRDSINTKIRKTK